MKIELLNVRIFISKNTVVTDAIGDVYKSQVQNCKGDPDKETGWRYSF